MGIEKTIEKFEEITVAGLDKVSNAVVGIILNPNLYRVLNPVGGLMEVSGAVQSDAQKLNSDDFNIYSDGKIFNNGYMAKKIIPDILKFAGIGAAVYLIHRYH